MSNIKKIRVLVCVECIRKKSPDGVSCAHPGACPGNFPSETLEMALKQIPGREELLEKISPPIEKPGKRPHPARAGRLRKKALEKERILAGEKLSRAKTQRFPLLRLQPSRKK